MEQKFIIERYDPGRPESARVFSQEALAPAFFPASYEIVSAIAPDGVWIV
jgi:hypothetical protein